MSLSNSTSLSTNLSKDAISINYLGDYMAVYLPYMILDSIGLICGTIGNTLVLLTIGFDNSLKSNPAYIFIFSLAFSDLLITIFDQTFTILGVLFGEAFYARIMPLCVFLGSFCLIACGTSLANMALLAINRYIHICHQHLYKKVFTKKNTILLCFTAWIFGFLVDLPNFLGWGGHFFDIKAASCMWNRLANHSYSIFFPVAAIFIPCIIIMILYIKIFVFAYKSKKKIFEKSDSLAKSLAIAKSLFLSFFLFFICWVPYGLVVSIAFDDHLPMVYHALVTFLAHINSTMNSIFYIALNPAFKKSFISLYRRITNKDILLGSSNSHKENKTSLELQKN